MLKWLNDRGPMEVGRIAASVFTEIPVTNAVEWIGGMEAFGGRCLAFIERGIAGEHPYLLPLAHHLVTTTGIGAEPKNFSYILLRIAANNVVCAVALEKAEKAASEASSKPSSKLVIAEAT